MTQVTVDNNLVSNMWFWLEIRVALPEDGIYSTPKYAALMRQIYCSINIYVHLVGLLGELSTRMHGTEILHN